MARSGGRRRHVYTGCSIFNNFRSLNNPQGVQRRQCVGMGAGSLYRGGGSGSRRAAGSSWGGGGGGGGEGWRGRGWGGLVVCRVVGIPATLTKLTSRPASFCGAHRARCLQPQAHIGTNISRSGIRTPAEKTVYLKKGELRNLCQTAMRSRSAVLIRFKTLDAECARECHLKPPPLNPAKPRLRAPGDLGCPAEESAASSSSAWPCQRTLVDKACRSQSHTNDRCPTSVALACPHRSSLGVNDHMIT